MRLSAAFNPRGVYRPGWFRRLCWFTTGVDRTLLCLPECPESERIRFMAIGGTMLILTGLALLSGGMAFYQIFYPGTNEFEFIGTPWRLSSSLGFAILWTLALYNMQRFLIFGSRRDSSKTSLGLHDYFHMMPGLVFSSLIGLTVATPLQVFVFGTEIDTQLVVERQEKLGQAFAAIDKRSENETRRLLYKSSDMQGMVSGRGNSRELDNLCQTKTLLDDAGEGINLSLLHACLQKYSQQIDWLEAALLASEGSSAVAGAGPPNLEAELCAAQIGRERLQAVLIIMQEPGLLRRAALAYQADPLFSWVLLLAVIFVQATPVLVSAMSGRGPYDDLVEMTSREKLAKEGIEPGVVYLFPELGGALAVDRYHKAKCVEREVRLELVGRRRQLREVRLHEFQRKFGDMHNRVWTKSTSISEPAE